MTSVTASDLYVRIFSHPDCTVGFGISPNQPEGSRTITAGEEFHLALKIIFLFREYSSTIRIIMQLRI